MLSILAHCHAEYYVARTLNSGDGSQGSYAQGDSYELIKDRRGARRLDPSLLRLLEKPTTLMVIDLAPQ